MYQLGNEATDMTIGEKLKIQRLSLGLSRKEFAHGIIDESYLSYIEYGISEIRVNNLIAILRQNNLSLISFLADFGNVDFSLSFYEKSATAAYVAHDDEKLNKIGQACPNTLTKVVIQFMYAKLNNQLEKFPKNSKARIKKVFWQMKQWNTDSLWIFSNVMEIYSFKDLEGLVNSVFHNFSEPAKYEDEVVKLLATISLNYLEICLSQKNIDNREVKKANTYLKNLPAIPIIAFEKTKGVYIVAVHRHDQKTVRKIARVLK